MSSPLTVLRLSPSGRPLSRYVTVPYDYSLDRLGSVTMMTTTGQGSAGTYTYDPWGNEMGTSPTTYNPVRYSGSYRDSSTSMYQMGARYYDPSTARFTQPDPMGGGYPYVSDNPVNLTDPSGLYPVTESGEPLSYTTVGQLNPIHSPETAGEPGTQELLRQMSDEELLQTVYNPSDGSYLRINMRTGGLVNGNARAYELQARAADPNSSITYDTAVPYVPYYSELIEGGGCSFSARTQVATARGERQMGDIKVGDKVLAYDQDSGATGSYTVTAVWVRKDRSIESLRISGESLQTTAEHPFYTKERGWVAAGNLRVGAHVRRMDGTYGVIERISLRLCG